MAKAASLQAMQSRGEYINHINMIRMRLVGSGNLQLTLFSLDDVENQSLVDLTMQSETNREANRLANFKQQRSSLLVKTTEINEIFKINRIIVYSKPIMTEYPG